MKPLSNQSTTTGREFHLDLSRFSTVNHATKLTAFIPCNVACAVLFSTQTVVDYVIFYDLQQSEKIRKDEIEIW